MLAVTGATGEVGGRVAVHLARLGLPQRLIVRDPSRAPSLPGAEVFQVASYGDPAAMGRALSAVDTMFLVSAHDEMLVIKQTEEGGRPLPYYDRLHQTPRNRHAMSVWRNAVPVSQGIRDAFSTGSQAQYPPHPSSW